MENLYTKVLKDIERKRERLRTGKINAIPLPLPAFSKFVPGLVPETQIGITTVSGGGKTAIATNFFAQTPFDFWVNNKDKYDFDIKIFLDCLEDSPEMTIKRFMIRALWTQLGIRLDMYTAECYFEDRQVSDDIKMAMDALIPYFEEFLSKVHIYDARNPYGIFKPVEAFLRRPDIGYIVDEKGNRLSEREEKECHVNFKKTYYKKANDNLFVIAACDNMNNIATEKGAETKWLACDKLTREYYRDKLCGFYKCTTGIIFQQNAETEEPEYTSDGDAITAKFMPSLGNISEYKNVTHSCHLVLGLFSPYRYKMENFLPPGSRIPYDIMKLQDFYRNMYILKGNFVGANINTSLFFDGMTGIISELPNAADPAMKEYYAKADELIKINSNIKPVKVV